jgi:hypothetical protein
MNQSELIERVARTTQPKVRTLGPFSQTRHARGSATTLPAGRGGEPGARETAPGRVTVAAAAPSALAPLENRA